MTAPEQPQIYLVSPPEFEPEPFGALLSELLARFEIACFRLALSSSDEQHVSQTADQLRKICHDRDVAIVIEDHFRLVNRLGLDGCHLSGRSSSVREIRKELGSDAIVGAFCGTSRHSGMSAGEAGADYVSFGPVSTSFLGTGEIAEKELFAWWSEMIEIPVVAEGGLNKKTVKELSDIVDFIAIGPEIWGG